MSRTVRRHDFPLVAAARTSTNGGDWVRARLRTISEQGEGTRDDDELLAWIRLIAKRRAHDVAERERDDVAQDAVIEVMCAVRQSLPRFVEAANPAALLERVTERAVGHARHRASMSGLGGVPANGRSWRKTYPRQLGGDAAARVVGELSAQASRPCLEVERAASRIAEFVLEHVDVELSADAIDAIVYVLDRLLDGVSRATLVRSANSGLRADPAMRYLGFEAGAAAAFACWLLGRDDGAHSGPSVLDAFLDGEAAPSAVARWRRQSIAFGFVADPDDVMAAGALVGTCRRTA